MTIVAWQQWQEPRARLNTAYTDSPQDFDGFFTVPPQPGVSLWVIPYFAGRVPMEAVPNYAYSGENADRRISRVEPRGAESSTQCARQARLHPCPERRD